MKIPTFVLAFCTAGAAALAGLSCNQNAAPTTAQNTSKQSLVPHQQAMRSAGPSQSSAASASNVPQPAIPAGARYTIFCSTFSGPAHAADAAAVRQRLLATGLREWHTLQAEKQTTLYYGYYRSVSDADAKDARERARAHNDLRAVSSLADASTGQRYFRSPFLLALEEADPTAPIEWDLRRATGYWSLQVAAFRDDARRKEMAIETVRELRKSGYPAYYFHGPSMSSVCLGAFPQEAVSVQKGEYTARNPHDIVVVVPESVQIPDRQITTSQGDNVDIVKPKVDVRDPTLLKLMNEFPHHSDNGVEGRRVMVRGAAKEVYQPTFLVVIPGNDASLARRQAPEAAGAEQVDPFQALQRGGSSGQGTQLRGYNDR